jgi:hypothetical protein
VNPSRVDYVTPFAFTRPEQVLNVIESLEAQKVRLVSWYPGLEDLTDTKGNSLAPLRRYLASHYHVAEHFASGHTILERNPEPTVIHLRQYLPEPDATELRRHSQ